MQHGPSFAPEEDPGEGLTPQGREVVRYAGRALKRLDLALDALITSPKTRARQSAEIVASILGFENRLIAQSELVKPMSPPDEVVDHLRNLAGSQRILVVGHLPHLARLASQLLSGQPDWVLVAFERGGVCRIDLENLGYPGRLVWCLPPMVSRVLGV